MRFGHNKKNPKFWPEILHAPYRAFRPQHPAEICYPEPSAGPSRDTSWPLPGRTPVSRLPMRSSPNHSIRTRSSHSGGGAPPERGGADIRIEELRQAG